MWRARCSPSWRRRRWHEAQAIELEADTAVPVRGSATLLSVLVRNLADNALRYSPDGARVVVTRGRVQQASRC